MNKAPRYMKEYASSIKKSAKKYKKKFEHENADIWENTIEQTDRIISMLERGLITEHEAMKMLVQLPY